MRYFDEATKTEVIVERDVSQWTTDENVQDAIKIAIKEYRKGTISLDDLSCICGHYYREILKTNKYPKLMSMLETGSDLAYFERFSSNFVTELNEVLDF